MASFSVSLSSYTSNSVTILITWNGFNRAGSDGYCAFFYPKINGLSTSAFTASSGVVRTSGDGIKSTARNGSATITFTNRNTSVSAEYGAAGVDGYGGSTVGLYSITYPTPSYSDYNLHTDIFSL